MQTFRMASIAALLIFCASFAKADLEAIDCGSTPFEYTGSTYNVDCEREDESIRADEATGGATTDIMTISSDDRTIFLTMVSIRITAPRIYLEYRGLGEGFRSYFNEEGVENWKSIGNKAGYDVAEFTQEISGYESRCITMQRYSNAAHTGYKRHIIGVGCTRGQIDDVYQILGQLDAPGD